MSNAGRCRMRFLGTAFGLGLHDICRRPINGGFSIRKTRGIPNTF
jgi:hypothetical protein